MKRVIVIHCIIFLLLLCIYPNHPTSATSNHTIISLSNNQVCVGDELAITLYFKCDYEFYGLSAIVYYENSVLEYISGTGVGGDGVIKIIESPSDEKQYSCDLIFNAIASGTSVISAESIQVSVLGDYGAQTISLLGVSVSVNVQQNSNNEMTGEITDGVFYEYNSQTQLLTINGRGVIPDFYSVSKTPWYSYSDKISSITIKDGVTAIGNNAFSRITALKTVNLPESVVKIGEGAFSDCPLLETVNIPSGVEEINYKTFYNCRNLKNIDISNVISIGDYAFYRCSALENVSFSNARYIGNFAFNKCTELKATEFSDTLLHIGERAFANCSQLIKADLPKSVIYVDETAFEGCDNLTVKGDLNGDRRTTAEDLTLIRKSLLSFLECDISLADVNGDGNFNIIDLVYLKKIIA